MLILLMLAKLGGITDEELDKIGMEAIDFAHDIYHILEVQRKNAEFLLSVFIYLC